MKFVTGGCCQGKKQWVITNWKINPEEIVDGAVCNMNALCQARVIDHFHLLVRRWLQNGKNPVDEMQKIMTADVLQIIITDEIGCGIVPLDPEERKWREVHGRICCQLAEEAECVIRVFAGVGQRIK